MEQTRWWKYVIKTINGRTFKEAAQIAGFDQSALTRWKNGARADPDFVVKFARNFDRNVLEALVEAEFITEQEANLQKVNIEGVALEEASDEMLSSEFLRRLKTKRSLEEKLQPANTINTTSGAPADDFDDDAIVARINAGVERVAAQQATPPIEENFI